MKGPFYYMISTIASGAFVLVLFGSKNTYTDQWLSSCFASASTTDQNHIIRRNNIAGDNRTLTTKDEVRTIASSSIHEGSTIIRDHPIIPASTYNSTTNQDLDAPLDDGSRTRDIADSWRQKLPPTLQNRTTLYKLNIDGCDVYLLGTSHVSNTSCHDVQSLINEVQPQGLFLELCGQRLAILSPPPQLPSPSSSSVKEEDDGDKRTRKSIFGFFGRRRRRRVKQKKAKLSEIVQNIKEQHPEMSHASATSSALLTKIQTDYASKLNITIGAEFREAYEAAQQLNRQKKILHQHMSSPPAWPYNGYYPPTNDYNPYCRVILGDRPVRLTLVRCWESLRWWGKLKLVLGLLWSSLFQPSSEEIIEWMESIMNGGTDLLTKSIDELRDNFPTIAKTVIEERDAYMFCKLVQMVDIFRHKNSAEGADTKNIAGIQTLVAVVGAGHCPGICRWVDLYNNRTRINALEQAHLPSGSVTGPESHEKRNSYIVGNSTIEAILKNLIETKKNRCEGNEEMLELLTQVVELHSA